MRIIRGSLLTFTADPFLRSEAECLRYEADGVVVVEDGKILAAGDAGPTLAALPAEARDRAEAVRHSDALIVPGFIDGHLHYGQTEIIGAYGLQLLDWLSTYTFPAERAFADPAHAADVAGAFLDELLHNGTTTCCAFCTVFPQSVDALFAEAGRRGVRLLAGKVCMDRNAPEWLRDTPQQAYDDSKALIAKHHGKGRAEYVITPRFAPTSSSEQLEALGALAEEFPDLAVQSHISENRDEVAWVRELFPECRDYADVYDAFGLLRPRAVYGHGVHLNEREIALFHERGAAVVHCPTSNLFLGSGCFNVEAAKAPARPLRLGLGTDVGGGTSFSMLQTMNEAYKVARLNGVSLSAARAFYLATRGSAESLGLAHTIGSIEPGLEADLAVLDLRATPLLERRLRRAESPQDILFALMILGDDRAVRAVYSGGELVHERRVVGSK